SLVGTMVFVLGMALLLPSANDFPSPDGGWWRILMKQHGMLRARRSLCKKSVQIVHTPRFLRTAVRGVRYRGTTVSEFLPASDAMLSVTGSILRSPAHTLDLQVTAFDRLGALLGIPILIGCESKYVGFLTCFLLSYSHSLIFNQELPWQFVFVARSVMPRYRPPIRW